MFRSCFKRVCLRRAYSQSGGGGNGSGAGKTGPARRFDGSMIKPALVIAVFGSVLNDVSAQNNRIAELEDRYSLKQSLLRNLMDRAVHGDCDFDVDKELQLANKLFQKKDKSAPQPATGAVQVGEVKEESLDEIWKNILDDANDDGSTARQDNGTVVSPDILTDKDALQLQKKKEEELRKMKPNTDVHVIVENPGELQLEAQNTTVPKFL